MELIATDDSYADRRQLFKDIWETALVMEDKEHDIANKPKVIKTLRLDDDDKYVIGKRKKERIKNLRTVCKKILEYCDRQDADEVFYEQLTGEPVPHTSSTKPKKLKTHRKKKKITQSISLHEPTSPKAVREPETTSAINSTATDKKDDSLIKTALPTHKNPIPFKYTRTSIIRKALVTNYNVRAKPAIPRTQNSFQNKTNKPRRKVVKKKLSKRNKPKKSSESIEEPEEWDNLLANSKE